MKLRDMLMRVVTPKLHEQYGQLCISVTEFDDETELESPIEEPEELSSLSGLGLVIEYENGSGVRTQRIVTCKQMSLAGGVQYLKAYCHHRAAIRTFRIDRILDVFDPRTGESLSPVQTFFAQFSPDQVSSSGLSWGLSVSRRADLIALLNALVFMARCDREYHPLERSTIEQALTSFWMRLEILGDPDFAEILQYADRLSPDGETFWLAMHRFREEPRLSEIFQRHARLLIEADNVIRSEEAYWLLEITEFLSPD